MTQPTPADLLRAAATKLREAATAATPGPWTWTRWHSDDCKPDCNDPACFLMIVGSSKYGVVGDTNTDKPEVFYVERSVQERGEGDAQFIALMHPGVGTVLAELIESGTRYADAFDVGPDEVEADPEFGRLIALARALLGEVAP